MESHEIILDNISKTFNIDRDKVEKYIKSKQEYIIKSAYYGIYFIGTEDQDEYKISVPVTSDLDINGEEYDPEKLAKYTKNLTIIDRADYGLGPDIKFSYSTRDEHWTKELSDRMIKAFEDTFKKYPAYPFYRSDNELDTPDKE